MKTAKMKLSLHDFSIVKATAPIDWLHNVSDFSAMMKEKRLNMSKDDYRVWLNEIERKTR